MASSRRSGSSSRKSAAGRPPSQRQLRVAELLRHRLSAIVARGEFDEKILNKAGITVTEVRIGPDLRHATAYVMPLGGLHIEKIIDLLNGYAPQLRKDVAKGLHLRYTPELSFKADLSFDEAASIERILNSDVVRRDVAPEQDASTPDDDASDMPAASKD